MPYTLKTQKFSTKDPNTGDYSNVDVFVEQGPDGGGAVDSVNGQTGAVVLDADDVGAIAEPSSAGTAGQVLGLDSNLDPVWVNPSGGDVSDVQINGTSILSNGVANIPISGANILGLVKKIDPSRDGVNISSDGTLSIYGAGANQVKNGTSISLPITPSAQHSAAFYGLAKAAGDTTQSASSNPVGTYTDDAKAAIQSMLGIEGDLIVVTVTGTTPTITAAASHRYKCGEVTELSFTPSVTGICDVVFTSGTTATILTVPNTVKWPDGFDPTSLEASTTYELNVVDGTLGGVLKWQ